MDSEFAAVGNVCVYHVMTVMPFSMLPMYPPRAVWNGRCFETKRRNLATEGGQFGQMAFSADGISLGCRTFQNALHIWRAPSWEEIEEVERRFVVASGKGEAKK